MLAALIAAVASIILTTGNLFWNRRQQRLEKVGAARLELDRFREPLLNAVNDLGNRLDNIRSEDFNLYFEGDRRELARRSTGFRLAQYLGWVEILYGASGHLHLTEDKATKGVADLIGWVGATLAKDDFDRIDEFDFRTSRLMLWREEQRAVGELMRTESDVPACIGYSSFDQQYGNFARWLNRFLDEVESTISTTRLANMQAILACLLVRLDVNGALVGWSYDEGNKRYVEKPRWIQSGRYPSLKGAGFALPAEPVRISKAD